MQKTITFKDAAKLLNVRQGVLYRLVEQAKIPAIRGKRSLSLYEDGLDDIIGLLPPKRIKD